MGARPLGPAAASSFGACPAPFAAREETTMTRRSDALRRTVRPLLLALLVLPVGTVSLLAAQPAAATVARAPARTVATAAATAENCSPAPAGNAFYVPPKPLPPGQHGDNLCARPVASPAAGAKARHILSLAPTVG